MNIKNIHRNGKEILEKCIQGANILKRNNFIIIEALLIKTIILKEA